MPTRKLKRSRRNIRTRRNIRKQRGGGEQCYKINKNGTNKTWSCSAACGENGACQTYD
jgi:hypothetical protein